MQPTRAAQCGPQMMEWASLTNTENDANVQCQLWVKYTLPSVHIINNMDWSSSSSDCQPSTPVFMTFLHFLLILKLKMNCVFIVRLHYTSSWILNPATWIFNVLLSPLMSNICSILVGHVCALFWPTVDVGSMCEMTFCVLSGPQIFPLSVLPLTLGFCFSL